MDAELRALLQTLVADPARTREIPLTQVGALVVELAAIQTQLGLRIQAEGSSGPGPESRVKPDRLLTPEQASGALGVTVRWLYRHAGDLPFTRRLSRKTLRFSEAGANNYITDNSLRHSRIGR
jgi:hypothetical protein